MPPDEPPPVLVGRTIWILRHVCSLLVAALASWRTTQREYEPLVVLLGILSVAVCDVRLRGETVEMMAPVAVRSWAVWVITAQRSLALASQLTLMLDPVCAVLGSLRLAGVGRSVRRVMRIEVVADAVVPTEAITSHMYDLP